MEEWLTPFKTYRIADRSFVFLIKHEIHNLAIKAKFSDIQLGDIDIVVSEITSNLIKHAGGGELLYRVRDVETGPALDIISIDKGPGMSDPKRMMKDGVSTTGTPGQGLGAIQRLSNKAQVLSLANWGTILYSSMGAEDKKTPRRALHIEISAITVNKLRESVCGDGYRFVRTESGTMIFCGDGLGHGPHAKAAVDMAGDFFMTTGDRDPVSILRQMHEHVRSTRGLVGVVAVLNEKANEWQICGIGNISARLYTGMAYKTYMSYNGTVGLTIPNSMNASKYPSERNQHLIMCTDGINSRWDLSRYPSIFRYDNMVTASAVYKDFTRGNDDASILIAKVV